MVTTMPNIGRSLGMWVNFACRSRISLAVVVICFPMALPSFFSGSSPNSCWGPSRRSAVGRADLASTSSTRPGRTTIQSALFSPFLP